MIKNELHYCTRTDFFSRFYSYRLQFLQVTQQQLESGSNELDGSQGRNPLTAENLFN
jgi:hypothetical protein